MSRRHFRPVAGLAGLFALALAGPTWAQQQTTNPRDNTPPARTFPALPGAKNAHADHGAKMMVHHALGMAIGGSGLQLTARELAANDAARADKKGSEVSERVRDLQRDARYNFEGANKMLADAYNMVRDREERAVPRRYYDAAARYTKTLYGLIGEPLAKSEDFGGGTDKDKDKDKGNDKALTAADIAAITLINHAVCEALDACMLRHATAHEADGTATERLREHAKQMASHSQRCVEKAVEHSGAKDTKDRQETPTVSLLARHARDLVQILEDDRDDNAPAGQRR